MPRMCRTHAVTRGPIKAWAITFCKRTCVQLVWFEKVHGKYEVVDVSYSPESLSFLPIGHSWPGCKKLGQNLPGMSALAKCIHVHIYTYTHVYHIWMIQDHIHISCMYQGATTFSKGSTSCLVWSHEALLEKSVESTCTQLKNSHRYMESCRSISLHILREDMCKACMVLKGARKIWSGRCEL